MALNEQIVNDTIKRMLAAGIDDETVISTLKDIGINEEQSKKLIVAQKSGSGEQETQEKEVVAPQRVIADNSIDDEAEQEDLKETTTLNMLDEHTNKLDEMNQKIEAVKKAVSTPSSVKEEYHVGQLEAKLDDISAQTKALFAVLKQILETDRKILTELQLKKGN